MNRSLAAVSAAFLTAALGADAQAQVSADDQLIVDAIRAAGSAPLGGEIRGLRSMGMGDAYVGGGSGSSAIFANPAGAITASMYEGTATYVRHSAADLHGVGAALVDAKTNPKVAAGASYSLGIGRNGSLASALRANDGVVVESSDRVVDHDIRGVLALPVVPGRVALGVGMHYFRHSHGSWTQRVTETVERTVGGTTTTTVESRDRDYTLEANGFALSAGAMATATENIAFGFAVSNLLDHDDAPQPRTFRGGAAVHVDALHIEAEWRAEHLADGLEHGFAAGLEFLAGSVPLRAGVRRESADALFLAAGIGFRTDAYGGDFSFEQNTQSSGDRRFGVGLSLYL